MALIVSGVLMLLLALLGFSSMQGAAQQERLLGHQAAVVQAFEKAEAALKAGEKGFSPVQACTYCLPPPEAISVDGPGVHSRAEGSSGLSWLAGEGGFYVVQNLGVSTQAATMTKGAPAALYRITAVGRQGAVFSVLESVFIQPLAADGGDARRAAWRQIH